MKVSLHSFWNPLLGQARPTSPVPLCSGWGWPTRHGSSGPQLCSYPSPSPFPVRGMGQRCPRIPPAGTYPSGSAALPSSGPSAWPPAAPLTGTAPPWGWGGHWLQSGPAGPAHSPPGLATGPAPGPPAYSHRQPRPPPPPAHPPRPPPRSSHLVQKIGGESEPWPRQVPPPTPPLLSPSTSEGCHSFSLAPHSSSAGGGSNTSP